ncbi:hypothetical protein GE21DRAFT_1211395 [Neurospora crassa]|nr:hypothetical protein GE21DRAFT_1211395 [Neurospora crassa]
MGKRRREKAGWKVNFRGQLLGLGVQDHRGNKKIAGGQAVDTSEWCFQVSRRGAVSACGTWQFQPCPATPPATSPQHVQIQLRNAA